MKSYLETVFYSTDDHEKREELLNILTKYKPIDWIEKPCWMDIIFNDLIKDCKEPRLIVLINEILKEN